MVDVREPGLQDLGGPRGHGSQELVHLLLSDPRALLLRQSGRTGLHATLLLESQGAMLASLFPLGGLSSRGFGLEVLLQDLQSLGLQTGP